MIIRNVHRLYALIFSLCSLCAQAASLTEHQQIQHCTHIRPRLERLACFDRLFHTPQTPEQPLVHSVSKPELWTDMVYYEQSRQDKTGFALHQSDDHNNLWLSTSALPRPTQTSAENADTPKAPAPILILACSHKISRIKILLPTPITQGQTRISITGKHPNTQRWLSDDSGLIVQSAQGLPAIDAMKSMLSSYGDTLTLRADIAAIDGLQFDISHLSHALKPLRSVCRW